MMTAETNRIDPALAKLIDLSNRDQKAARSLIESTVTNAERAEWQNFGKRQSCIRGAMAKPLPGNSFNAFARGAINVAGVTVKQVVPVHFLVLQALGSPVLKAMEAAALSGDGGKANIELDDEQQFELCYTFTADVRKLRETLKTNGVKAIREDAHNECDNADWPAAKINVVILAIMEQLKRHVETTIKFAAELEEKNDVRFFQATSMESSKPAESAG